MSPVLVLMLISPVGSSASTSGSRTSHVQRRDDGTRAQSLDTRTDRSTFLIFDVQNIHEEQADSNVETPNDLRLESRLDRPFRKEHPDRVYNNRTRPIGSIPNMHQGGNGVDPTTQQPKMDYPNEISPFQLLLTAHDEVAWDHMLLMNVTKSHLECSLQQDDEAFDRLEMFQLLHDPVETLGLTMVAISGTAHYARDGRDGAHIADTAMLAFLGTNASRYLLSLQRASISVDQAQLFTLDGRMVDFRNGNMMIPSDAVTQVDSVRMTDAMSLTVIAVAIGVPLVLFLMICFGYAHLYCQGYTFCGRRNVDPEGDVWRAESHAPFTHVQEIDDKECDKSL